MHLTPLSSRSRLDRLTLFASEGQSPLDSFAWPAGWRERAARVLKKAPFNGRKDESLTIPTGDPHLPLLDLVGLGGENDLTLASLKKRLKSWAGRMEVKGKGRIGIGIDVTPLRLHSLGYFPVLARSAGDAFYSFDDFTEKERPDVTLFFLRPEHLGASTFRTVLKETGHLVDGITFTRSLANAPANHLPPEAFARRVEDTARPLGWRVEIWNEVRLKKERMTGLISVGRASSAPPRLAIVSLNPGAKRRAAFIGKGIVFDSGGLNLKPSSGIELMKYDKCGAAAVAGLIPVLPHLNLKLGVDLYLPLAENVVSGSATHPGDILTFRDGTTVEVVNTDAEGRLILADALILARERDYLLTVDLATLTGACRVALGDHAAGLMGNREDLITAITGLSQDVGEWTWPLPLWKEYEGDIKGRHARIKNVGTRWGGAITAGHFLRRFIDPNAWCHLDIAGVAYKPHNASAGGGAFGWGVALLTRIAKALDERELPLS